MKVQNVQNRAKCLTDLAMPKQAKQNILHILRQSVQKTLKIASCDVLILMFLFNLIIILLINLYRLLYFVPQNVQFVQKPHLNQMRVFFLPFHFANFCTILHFLI